MDNQQLFWATGINNAGLQSDAQSAIAIFQNLSAKAVASLDAITQKYQQLQQTAKVKFENPVDPQMVSSIKNQIGELGKTIDIEIQKLGRFASTYDQSMQKIQRSASKLGTGAASGVNSSPLAPMVAGIQKDVSKAADEMTFLERRFKYMWGSMLAYGSVNILQNVGSDIIRVKTQFEQLGIAINSFVGNAEVGNKILGELTAWAVKSPLQILDITDAAKQMLAYGDAADTVVGSVKMLGDIAAGSGQSVKDLAYLYGTSQTQGRLMLRDLYQFGNRGIPIYSALGEVLGKNTAEIMKMTSAGKIGFPELKQALESLTAAGGQYYNLSEKMAASTSGQISNLKDKWTMAMKDIGEEQDGVINAGVQGITALISHWKELGEAIVVVGTALGSYQLAKMFVGWTAEANLATVATTKLKTVTTALFTAIKAHPYAAAFVAVSSLVAIMWALRDSTTAAEKAQKNLKTALDNTLAWADRMNKRFGDNLDKIKNKSLDGTIEQAKAYQDIATTFGKVLTKQELLNLKTEDSVTLQNKVAKAVNYSTLTLEKNTIAKAKSAVASEELKKKEAYSVVQKQSPNISYNQFSKSYEKNSESLKTARLTLSGAMKQYNDDLKLYNTAKVSVIPDSFSKQIADAKREVKDLSAALKDLKSGKGNEVDFSKAIDDKTKQLKEAQDKLDILTGNTKKERSAANAANKQKISTNERLAAILRDQTKLTDASTKAEIELADATLASMDEGYAKEKKQLDIKHQEKILAIKKQGEQLLELQNKIMINEALVKNPKAVPPKASTKLSVSNQGTITTLTEAETKENDAATKKLLNDKLIEYGDYAAERVEIEKKFNADISALESERTAKNSTQIDDAVRQAETEKSKALMAQSFKKMKESPEFAMAFEDLGNVSTATLEKLMAELEKLKTTAAGTLKLSDYKEYSSVIENLTDEFIKRNPFKVLKESAEELAVAQKKLTDAQRDLANVKAGVPVITGISTGTVSYSNEPSQNEAGDVTKLKKLIAPQLKMNSATKAGIPIHLSLAKAINNEAVAQDEVTAKHNKSKKAITEVTKEYAELFKQISSVGSSIGGTAGEIISAIGGIGSFVTSAIDGVVAVSATGAAAISTVEKASVILGIISTAITVATTIANLFSASSKKRKEEAEKERQSILDVKQAYLEAYAAMTNKKFDNIFGEDVWGKAKAQGELLKKSLSNFKDSYNEAIKENKGRGWGDFTKIFSTGDGRGAGSLYGKEWSQAIFDNFDLVEAKARLANKNISESERTILDALVNSYESYQSYLDNITSYLSSVFGEIGDSMMDSLFDNYDDLTTWADDVTGYISDSFKEMVKDIVYSMFFADKLKAAQEKIKAIMVDDDSTDNASQITAVLTELNAGIIASGKDAVDFMTMMDDGWKKAMGESFFTKDNTDTNSTTSAIKGMDQPTADILTAQFSAIRINVASILAKIPEASTFLSINNNVSDILLSLQTQANSLQMVFADISAIKINTDRLKTIENYLWSVVNNGITMK